MNPMTLIQKIAMLAGGGILVLYLLIGITGLSPGEVGVLVKNIGDNRGMQKETLGTGWYWIEPVAYDVVVYNAKLRQYPIEDLPANTKDGQPISVDVSFEMGLDAAGVPRLHETVGPDYYDQVVYPAARSQLREATAFQLSDHIYTGEGRAAVQAKVQKALQEKLGPRGILIQVNVRDVEFTDEGFVQTLEKKAAAAQNVVIAQREAERSAQEAIRVANIAEGEKQKAIKEAESRRESKRLDGEGARLFKEEEAKGILATLSAEAEGARLKNAAMLGPGGDRIVQLEWARNLGPNVKVYAVPTGAPGTTAIMDLNGIMKGALKGD